MLIPLHCEYFALEGLADLVGTMRRVRGALNPALDIEGVLLTMYDDRTNLGQLVARDVREFFKEKVFNTIIPRNVRLGEAPSHGIPGVLYDAKSRGAAAYVALAKEMLARTRAHDARFHDGELHDGQTPRTRQRLSALIPDAPPALAQRRARSRHRSARAERAAAAHADGRREARRAGAVDQGQRHHSADPRAPHAARRYRIIAGERRWRAAQRAGLHKVPVVVREVAGGPDSSCSSSR